MENPYRTPSSTVADHHDRDMRGPRPSAVSRACRLLWLALGIDAASLIPGIRVGLWDDLGAPVWLVLAFTVALLVAAAALILAVERGRNWGRYAIALFLAVSWLLTLTDIPEFLKQGELAVALDGIVLSLEAYACFLLFSTESARWFTYTD